MKSHRLTLLLILLSLSTVTFAQSEAQKSNPPKSDAQKSFDTIKSLAGSWQGAVNMNPAMEGMGKRTWTSHSESLPAATRLSMK